MIPVILEKLTKRLWENRFLRFSGPAMIISVAYIDPGNFGTDIAAGASYGYELLWVVWLASGMAMLLQYLSGKIGIATGRSMPELMRERLGSLHRPWPTGSLRKRLPSPLTWRNSWA
jgi:manganese transport protein